MNKVKMVGMVILLLLLLLLLMERRLQLPGLTKEQRQLKGRGKMMD
jgi:hypothetical protein